ncbi:hypothetical protein GCM10023169_34440 [Georgenia halophila]|uniref:Peptidase S9 prolyl oligopeptidase catalytic domain-containing protein n=1 Tax=Georgenia halophila TaxID=620889 RepID=A0ABP8LKX7_9MICO
MPSSAVPGWRTEEVHLDSYGARLGATVLRPDRPDAHEPVVVLPFYEVATLLGEPCARTAGRPHRAAQAYGLQLAAQGVSVLAVPWWFEQEAAADESTAGNRELGARYGPAAERHGRRWPMTGLGRSLGDLLLALDFLGEQSWVDPARIGVFGHSLGGKLALHLAALDTRVVTGVAHEAGLGFAHSNWSDPWYLGEHVPDGRDQDEVLALVAPRRFLIAGGGDGDGPHNRDLVERARRAWDDPHGLQLLHHDGGHPPPPHVRLACMSWLAAGLDGAIR